MLFAEDRLAAELALVKDAVRIGFALHVLVHGGHRAGHGVFGHPPVGNEQLGDLFLDAQHLYIGGGALGRGVAPVVYSGECTAAVNILEGQTVLLKNTAIDRGDNGAICVAIGFDSR